MKNHLLAARPKTLTAAIVPIVVCWSYFLSQSQNPNTWLFVCALISSVAIQIATNFFNDLIDFKKGADFERIGPTRVTSQGLMSSKQVLIGGLLALALAVVSAIPLVVAGGVPLLILGLVSMYLAYGYTGGPFPLAYLGLGEIFVILFFGFAPFVGMTIVHHASWTMEHSLISVAIGCLAAVLIAINNLRDEPTDRKVVKKTLAVRIGRQNFLKIFALLLTLPYLTLLYWAFRQNWFSTILPLFTLPLAIKIFKFISQTDPDHRYNQYLGRGAALHLLYGVLFSLGLIIDQN